MKTKRQRQHAIIAWLWVKECARECYREASQDYAFVRFVLDMKEAYPREFEKVTKL